jgi:hypothetical protein
VSSRLQYAHSARPPPLGLPYHACLRLPQRFPHEQLPKMTHPSFGARHVGNFLLLREACRTAREPEVVRSWSDERAERRRFPGIEMWKPSAFLPFSRRLRLLGDNYDQSHRSDPETRHSLGVLISSSFGAIGDHIWSNHLLWDSCGLLFPPLTGYSTNSQAPKESSDCTSPLSTTNIET